MSVPLIPSNVEELMELFCERDLLIAEHKKTIHKFDTALDDALSHVYEAIFDICPTLNPSAVEWAPPHLVELEDNTQAIRIEGYFIEQDDDGDDVITPIVIVVPPESLNWTKDVALRFFADNQQGADTIVVADNTTTMADGVMDFDVAMEQWLSRHSEG